MPVTNTILELRDVKTCFGGSSFLGRAKPPIRAVDGVSFALQSGEVLGIIGESGSRKSTLARTILGIQRETDGKIWLNGRVVSGLEPHKARTARRKIQYVHQDPGAALDPWWSIGSSLVEGLAAQGMKSKAEMTSRIDAILDAVGMPRDCQSRYPHELSGGQLRRIGIARILCAVPGHHHL